MRIRVVRNQQHLHPQPHYVIDDDTTAGGSSNAADDGRIDEQQQQQVIKEEEELVEEEEDDDEEELTLAQFSANSKSTNHPPTPFPSTPPSTSQVERLIKSKALKISLLRNRKKKKRTTTTTTKRKIMPSTNSKLVQAVISGKLVSSKGKKAAVNGSSTSPQVKSPTIIRAEEIQSSLGHEFPSFIKFLVRSHVSSCFWMGLPTPICKLHLPNMDTTVVLEDENGEHFEAKYIAEKTGLSAGWRKFAVSHELLEGDVLLFQVVEPTKFKVYIIRANDLPEVDRACSLVNLGSHTEQTEADNENGPSPLKQRKRKPLNTLPLSIIPKKNKRTITLRSVRQLGQVVEQSGNDSEEVGSEVLEGSKLTAPSVPFENVASFEDFRIVVNGLCIDSELPEHIRVKYYELCRNKNAFLHNRFLPGLYSKLVAGIIGETVNIADAIKGCKLTTSRDEFAVWDKSLISFELLGMNVEFLRNRLHLLQHLVLESGGASDVKTYNQAKAGLAHAEDEIRDLEAKLVELKEASKKFEADIEMLQSKAEKYELEFQEEVDAPW